MKIEIFSWRVWELWEEEIPGYLIHVKRLWLDITSGAWKDALHSLSNITVEFFRCFAYTLGHLVWVWVIYKALLVLIT